MKAGPELEFVIFTPLRFDIGWVRCYPIRKEVKPMKNIKRIEFRKDGKLVAILEPQPDHLIKDIAEIIKINNPSLAGRHLTLRQ